MDVINNKNLDVIRNMIIYENQQRLQNNEQLIDTKRKCEQFLNNRNAIIDEKYVPINWVKFCVGDEYFSVLKGKYCYDLNEFKSACQLHNINNIDSYKANHINWIIFCHSMNIYQVGFIQILMLILI